MEFHSSAFKHGIARDDIEHAVRNAVVIKDLDDGYVLVLGPRLSAGFLEVLVRRRSNESPVVIHAMTMRPKYRQLLPREA